MKKDDQKNKNVERNIAIISLLVAIAVLLVGDNLLGRWGEKCRIDKNVSEIETSFVDENASEVVNKETDIKGETASIESDNDKVEDLEKESKGEGGVKETSTSESVESPSQLMENSNQQVNTIDMQSETIQESSHNQSNNMESLALEIDEYEHVDKFYYEYQLVEGSNEYIIIDFEDGLTGTFKYSRDLTESERANWGHGGSLYDAEGRSVGSEGDYPVFWSTPEGKFAVQFPQNMPSGVYDYELYHVINNRTISDTITFEIE